MGYYAAGNRMHGAPPSVYLPIEEHGIVGDLRTVALVGTDAPSTGTAPPASTPPDGEGTFNLCSFWYVEALTRAGRVREARTNFEKMLTYSNHLGLYAEQIGASGEALGNFPQAFTHLALISAAVNLDRALDRR